LPPLFQVTCPRRSLDPSHHACYDMSLTACQWSSNSACDSAWLLL
jgi:hypothetical protein